VDTLVNQFDILTNSAKLLGDNLRHIVKVLKTLRTQVNKLEKAEHKRDAKRKSKGERKSNTNSGFQKKHNIEGTPLAEFLGTDEASMVDAHKAICAYIKGREGVAKFPGDERIIVMDDTLDTIFPGLIENYPDAIELASKAVAEINDNKERRAYLDKHIDNDTVLTYSGIMKRLPHYFKKDTPAEA
jgi:chromatin remodeling complex protein RSC6